MRLAPPKKELAARLGTVRDMVSRSLCSLQNEELIRVQGRQVAITDRAAVEREAG